MPESVRESPNSGTPERRPDPNQERAIRHAAGPAQIFAGPGSGKTYVTVHRIRHLITRLGVEPEHILVITFTKAAALEMQNRFFRLMEPERPPVRFGTFHAVFYHILRQSPQYRGYSIITESEKKKLFRQIIHMHRRFAGIQEEDLDEIIACADACRRSSAAQAPSLREIGEEDILFLAEEFETYLEEFHKMDFGCITGRCHRLLTEHKQMLDAWRAQFQFILIDEFQDISPDQYALIKLLAAPENNLFVVGDDDQSIYGFRGASPDSMRAFMRDFPGASEIFLDVNYRCGGQIVDAAARVISCNRNRIDKTVRAVHEEGAGFHVHVFLTEEEQETYLIGELLKKREQGELNVCAILCRTNYDCALMAQRLRRRRIPYVIKECLRNPYDHFVVRDLMAYLALADGQLTRRHFLRIMNRPVRYFKRESVPEERVSFEALAEYYKDMPSLREEVRKLSRDLKNLRGKGLHLQIRYIRKIIGYDRYLREKYGAERAGELMLIAADFQELAAGCATYGALCDYISQYGENLKRNGSGEQGGQHPQDGSPEGVRLMTMHASKGLEFDTVYLPDCQEGKIPSNKSKTEAQIEEERRMFYVAMTRAKKELCVTAHKEKNGKDAPSRFLQCLCQSSSGPSPTSSSNSAASRYSSNASATASYSSSSSI